MSALAERVGRTHYAATNEPRYVLCNCDEEFSSRIYHAEHVAEVTAAEIAAEIRAERTQVPTGDVAGQIEAAALGRAATIAEGKTND